MKALVFDTETTGLPVKGAPADHPDQPRMVQLAALLLDDFKVRNTVSVIVKPEGFEIPAKVSQIHGISTELANRVGVSAMTAVCLFFDLVAQADVLVAHDLPFDDMILRIEVCRIDCGIADAAGWDKKTRFCTMGQSVDVLKLPGNGGYRRPKLTEAYKFFFGKDVEGAHDALNDARACASVYRKLTEGKDAATA